MPSGFERFVATHRARLGRGPARKLIDRLHILSDAKLGLHAAAGRLFQRTGGTASEQRSPVVEPKLAQALADIEFLSGQVRQLTTAVEALSAARHVNLHLPFTQRAQALKMIREGRSAKQVAAALGLPEGEVLLLRRVQEIQMGETSFAVALRQLTQQTGDAA